MDYILLSGALAFLITFFSIPIIIQIARDKKLFDEPDERKVHKMVIPTLGGLGIFAGFILAMLLGAPAGATRELSYFAAAAIVIFFLGIKDDILIISAGKKFLGQLIAAGIIINFSRVQITNLHGFLGIYELPQMASILFTLLTMIVIINSFNLIDGVDGLAGSLGLVTSIGFGLYFYFAGTLTYSVIAFALAGSLIGFLIYNFSPAKIFMGDTGSLLIGLVNALLVVRFINTATASDAVLPLESAPAIGFAMLIVPLFDTLRVFTLRILDRRSPFSPDRNHIHHFLLDLGMSHRRITLTCVAANLGFIGMAVALRSIGTTYLILALLVSGFALVGLVYYLRPKPNKSTPTDLEKHEESSILRSGSLFTMPQKPVEVEN